MSQSKFELRVRWKFSNDFRHRHSEGNVASPAGHAIVTSSPVSTTIEEFGSVAGVGVRA